MELNHDFAAAGLLGRLRFNPLLLLKDWIFDVRAAFLSSCLALSLSGCAVDCSSDWYAVGQRDGRLGAIDQSSSYQRSCSGVDTAQYQEGWREGFSHRPLPGW
jgi:hypothetical protein